MPSSWIVPETLLQLPALMPLVFSWSGKPVESEGQEKATVFVVVSRMASDGTRLNKYAAPASVGFMEFLRDTAVRRDLTSSDHVSANA